MSETFPRKYGRYRLLGVLGAGGMGVVYRAETEPLAGVSRTVAIKQVQPGNRSADSEDDMIEMLLDEARIWVRLQHPNIVSVVDFGQEKEDWFLALELIDGVTVQDLLDKDGKLPVPEALCIVERVARALAYAHGLSADDGKKFRIVHRDVKPANILVSARGEIKLTDFGIARATNRRAATQAGQVRGSLRVMSPEQVLGEPVDARSDLFSLGCTLHELVTGSPLLHGSREDVLRGLSRKTIPSPAAGMPPAVRDLVVRLTAAEPSKRPASAEEVARQARAMLLPEAVEEVEHALASRVKRARADRSERVPASGDTGSTTEPKPSVTMTTSDVADVTATARSQPPPSQQPTVPFREIHQSTEPLPPGARPAKPWERPVASSTAPDSGPLPTPAWQFHTRVAIAIVLALGGAIAGVAWVLGGSSCKIARLEFAHAHAGTGTVAALGESAARCARYCGDDPELRIATAAGLFFGGKPSAEAAIGLGTTPEEQRFAATLRVASRGWNAASARNEALALSPDAENACLAEALEFNAGAKSSLEVPVIALRNPCAQVLAISESLRTDRLGEVDALVRAAGGSKGAHLAEAVLYSLDGTAAQVEAKIERALRVGLGEDASGVWVPSSFTNIEGDRGRLTTPIDDLPALGALLAGDALARQGEFAGAEVRYRKAAERGWRHPDLYARQVDLYIHGARFDAGKAPPGPSGARGTVGTAAAQLATAADPRLGHTDALIARVAMAHLAANDPAAAAKALGAVKNPQLSATVAAEIERRRRPK